MQEQRLPRFVELSPSMAFPEVPTFHTDQNSSCLLDYTDRTYRLR